MMKKQLGWIEVVSLAWVVAVPLIEAFRGLDVTDTGFLLSNQYWVFRDPSAAAYWFHLWLTNVLGGLVVWASGPAALFVSKIAAAALFWGLAWAVFRLFGKDVDRRWIWLGVAATLVFDFAGKINIIHYNNLSVLFFAWGIVALVEGTVSRRPVFFAVAGAILAANALVRLPNILGLSLIVVPFLVDILARKTWAKSKLGWRHVLAYLAGALIAALAAAAVMIALGHWQPYVDSLAALGAGVSDAGSHYGLMSVFRRPIKATALAIAGALVLGGGLFAVGFLLSKVRVVWGRVLAAAIGLAVGVAAAVLVSDIRKVASPVVGLIYLTALAGLFWRFDPQNSRLPLAATLSALVVFLLNWGSDTGVAVATYAVPLAIPGLLLFVLGSPWRWVKPAVAVLVCTVAAYGTWTVATKVYRDTPRGTVMAKSAGIGPVFTSAERAGAVDDLTARIRTYSRPGDSILVADSLPLVHYLTQTKPYLGNPWPALFTPRELADELALREKTSLPALVVLAKTNARQTSWPRGNAAPPVGEAELKAFLERNRFALVEETAQALFYTRNKDTP